MGPIKTLIINNDPKDLPKGGILRKPTVSVASWRVKRKLHSPSLLYHSYRVTCSFTKMKSAAGSISSAMSRSRTNVIIEGDGCKVGSSLRIKRQTENTYSSDCGAKSQATGLAAVDGFAHPAHNPNQLSHWRTRSIDCRLWNTFW